MENGLQTIMGKKRRNSEKHKTGREQKDRDHEVGNREDWCNHDRDLGGGDRRNTDPV